MLIMKLCLEIVCVNQLELRRRAPRPSSHSYFYRQYLDSVVQRQDATLSIYNFPRVHTEQRKLTQVSLNKVIGHRKRFNGLQLAKCFSP